MGASTNSEIQDFSGGINLARSPHLIAPSEATFLRNVDVRKGSLRSVGQDTFIEPAGGPYFFEYSSRVHYYNDFRSNVVWNNIWYWTGASAGKMLTNGTIRPLGVTRPTGKLGVAEDTPTADGLAGEYTYVYTYYEAETGAESAPSDVSASIEVDAKAIKLTGFMPSPNYRIRLYRLGGMFTVYTAVTTLPGNTTEYIDELKYTEVDGSTLTTIKAFPPPQGIQGLTEYKGRFFGFLADKLYYTPPGNPDSWYLLDYIGFGRPIKMIANTQNALIVCTSYETWALYGTGPETFTKHKLNSIIGSLGHEGLAHIKGSAIWLGANNLVISDGTTVEDLSMAKLGELDYLAPVSAVSLAYRYFVSVTGPLVPSNNLVPGPLGGDDADATVGDLVPGKPSTTSGGDTGIFQLDLLPGRPVFSYVGDETITTMGVIGGQLHRVSAPAATANITTETGAPLVTEDMFSYIVADVDTPPALLQMFSADHAALTYESPVFTEGLVSVLKQYEKVRVTYYGTFIITIMDANGEVMQTAELASDTVTSEWVGISVTNNRAYAISFRIEGAGEIFSLAYTWTPREGQ